MINKETSRFCEFLASLEGLHQSGTTEQDKVKKHIAIVCLVRHSPIVDVDANYVLFLWIFFYIENEKAMYRSTYKRNYNFEHCWLVLKNQPKWSIPKEKS